MSLKLFFNLLKQRLNIFIFFSMVFVSVVLLPVYNNSKDFFIFSPWNMFAFVSTSQCVDITWDGGKSYLFRDHRKDAASAGININTLFYLMNASKVELIRKDHLHKIKSFCRCENVEYFVLRTNYFDHFFVHTNSNVLSRFSL